jgi:hypothetical protein
MKEKFEHMDELFRKNMFNYSTPPPEIVWNRIENSLSQNKKRSVIPFYLKIASGIVFLTGLTALFVKLTNEKPLLNTEVATQTKTELNTNIPQFQNSNSLITKEIPLNSVAKRKLPKVLPDNPVHEINNPAIDPAQGINSVLANETLSLDVVFPEAAIADGSNHTASSATEIRIDNTDVSITAVQSINTDTVQSMLPQVNNLLDDLLTSNESEKQKSLKWTIGGQAGPQYSYRKLTTHEQAGTSNIDYETYDAPLLAYAGGMQVQVEPTKRLSIQSGVYYSKIGQSISSRNFASIRNDQFDETSGIKNNQPVEIVNSIGTLESPDVISDKSITNGNIIYTNNMVSSPVTKGEFSGKQVFEYVEVPLILRYRIIAQKIGVNLFGGVNANILINNYTKVSDNSNNEIEMKTSDMKSFNYSGTIGFGFDYPVSKKIFFTLEPFFKYYLTPINESSQADAQPYMIGIMTGFNYSF